MRAISVLLVVTACAAPVANVRDIDGHPLPTSARLDADSEPAQVRCDGKRYFIVEAPPPYSTGTRVGTARVWISDPREMCARIRANS